MSTHPCPCSQPKPVNVTGGRACFTCGGTLAPAVFEDEKEGDETTRNRVNMGASRKSSRAMTDVERQLWRDLCRQTKMYEETFGVRYSRD